MGLGTLCQNNRRPIGANTVFSLGAPAHTDGLVTVSVTRARCSQVCEEPAITTDLTGRLLSIMGLKNDRDMTTKVCIRRWRPPPAGVSQTGAKLWNQKISFGGLIFSNT